MKHKTQAHTLPGPNPISKPKKIMTRFNSSPLPLCFRPSTTTPTLEYPHPPPSTTTSTTTSTPYLSTSLHQTHLGIFSLTWSHTLFSRSLHLTLHPPQPPQQPPSPSLSSTSPPPPSHSSPSFHLTLKKPFLFWNKHGSKKLSPSLSIHWDLSQARFGPGPEPTSGFYIALLHQGQITLLIGDLHKEALTKTKPKNPTTQKSKLIIRREHIFGSRFFSTTTVFGSKSRNILIELGNHISKSGCTDDPRLVIRVDNKRILQVKHLKWKFRGSERVEVDGTHIQLSWDVCNFLFDEENNSGSHNEDGYALFTFRFEEEDEGLDDFEEEGQNGNNGNFGGVILSTMTKDSCGLNYERKKMKKKMLSTRSVGGSSSSISSVSSGSSSSVLEWESVEENELKGPTGFSLLLYAWKKC